MKFFCLLLKKFYGFRALSSRCSVGTGVGVRSGPRRVQLKCDGTRWRTAEKWRGNWRMEWVASTLHTTSEHGVSSITSSDAHTSAASSRLNWRPCRFKWTRPFRRKTKSGFCACAITFQTQSTLSCASAKSECSYTPMPPPLTPGPERSQGLREFCMRGIPVSLFVC